MFGDSIHDVRCPYCQAGPGVRCFNTKTGDTRAPHSARKDHRQSADGQVEVWNHRHPIGTAVVAFPGARPSVGTAVTGLFSVTASEAWVLGGHTAVVMVKGHGAVIALTHVDPR